MKQYLEKGYRLEKKFDAKLYNSKIEKQLKKILKNKN